VVFSLYSWHFFISTFTGYLAGTMLLKNPWIESKNILYHSYCPASVVFRFCIYFPGLFKGNEPVQGIGRPYHCQLCNFLAMENYLANYLFSAASKCKVKQYYFYALCFDSNYCATIGCLFSAFYSQVHSITIAKGNQSQGDKRSKK